MPLYRIAVEAGSLSDPTIAALAAEITDFHCQLTGLEPSRRACSRRRWVR